MKTILTDNTTNDLYLDASGNIAIGLDIVALANVSKNKVLTNLGEPEFNQEDGIPYFDTIFCDEPKIDLFQAALISTVESQDEVQRVSNFEYSQENNIYSYTMEIISKYGVIELNG